MTIGTIINADEATVYPDRVEVSGNQLYSIQPLISLDGGDSDGIEDNMNLQVIGFSDLTGAGSNVEGRSIKAYPVPGQYVDASLIDSQSLSGATDASGMATITLICGITYEVQIQGWGTQMITVNEAVGTLEAPYAFTNYLDGASASPSPLISTNFITAQDGTVWQFMVVDNGDGTWSQSYVRVK